MSTKKMINSDFDFSNPLDTGGVLAIIGSIFMNIYNWVSVAHINAILVFFTSLFACIFAFYKFRNERITYQKNREERKRRKKDANRDS